MSNALRVEVKKPGYSYVKPLTSLSPDVISNSINRFQDLKEKQIMLSESFYDSRWTLYDETRTYTISFEFDHQRFNHVCKPIIGCTAEDFCIALKVLVIESRYSLPSLQNMTREILRFISTLDQSLSISIESSQAISFLRLLDLIQPETEYSDDLKRSLHRASDQDNAKTKPRTLAFFMSCFLFHDLLRHFWANDATPEEKLTYFPIYFWWHLSIHLPLRPICVAVTPRNCIKYENGVPKIIIRRTLKKQKGFACSYDLENDYKKEEHPIQATFAKEIEDYIAQTKDKYRNKADTLFCKATHSDLWESNNFNDLFTLETLNGLRLRFFYNIIHKKYGYFLTAKQDGEQLGDREIEIISLGDTRHLSLITLMLTGNSPYACQLLAGHTNIMTGDNYYGNLKNIIHALITKETAYKPVRPKFIYDAVIERPEYVPVENGVCYSAHYLHKDFSDCCAAVSESGEIAHCPACQYFQESAAANDETLADCRFTLPSDDKLKSRYLFLIDALNKARQGLGCLEDIQITLEKLQAETRLYRARFMRWSEIMSNEEE